jgi:hypothetical protein
MIYLLVGLILVPLLVVCLAVVVFLLECTKEPR